MGKVCKIDGCAKPLYGRGWCRQHYDRWWRHGDPLAGGIARGSTQEFIDYATQYKGSDCLLWPYSQNENGYGTAFFNGKKVGAHRIICIKAHGAAPTPKHQTAHSCGVRMCCNPSHLRWATRAENEVDKYLHDTHQRGEKNHQAKLSEQEVRQILTHRGVISQSKLAKMYGVSRQAISDIHRGRSWPWLKAAMEAGRHD